MGRRKKVDNELSSLEKNYIDLTLKHTNNVNYDLLFAKLAAEINKPEQIVRDYADRIISRSEPDNLPPVPEKKKELTPLQENVRNQFTPARLSESNKNRHVTIMTDGISEMLEKNPPPIKGSNRYKDCIYRQ